MDRELTKLWGMRIPPKAERTAFHEAGIILITGACLGENAKRDERVILTIQRLGDDQEIAVCSLQLGVQENVSLDLPIQGKYVLKTKGAVHTEVHVFGRIVYPFEYGSADTSTESSGQAFASSAQTSIRVPGSEVNGMKAPVTLDDTLLEDDDEDDDDYNIEDDEENESSSSGDSDINSLSNNSDEDDTTRAKTPKALDIATAPLATEKSLDKQDRSRSGKITEEEQLENKISEYFPTRMRHISNSSTADDELKHNHAAVMKRKSEAKDNMRKDDSAQVAKKRQKRHEEQKLGAEDIVDQKDSPVVERSKPPSTKGPEVIMKKKKDAASEARAREDISESISDETLGSKRKGIISAQGENGMKTAALSDTMVEAVSTWIESTTSKEISINDLGHKVKDTWGKSFKDLKISKNLTSFLKSSGRFSVENGMVKGL